MNRLLQIATLVIAVLALASKSHADPITALGEIHSTLSIISVVDSSNNPVSKTGLVIQSEPFAAFDDISSGVGFSSASAVADGG